MPKSDYADILASHEKHPSAQEETSLPNPALIGSQEPEVGSYPSENPNNDALCNGVAPARKADGCSSDVPVTRCTDAQMSGFDLPDALMNFLGDYLVCTEQQRLVLALWIIHTHCLAASDFSPYLDIRSSQK